MDELGRDDAITVQLFTGSVSPSDVDAVAGFSFVKECDREVRLKRMWYLLNAY